VIDACVQGHERAFQQQRAVYATLVKAKWTGPSGQLHALA